MGVLVYLIGLPRFASESEDELVARFDAAIDKLKEKQSDAEVAAVAGIPPQQDARGPIELQSAAPSPPRPDSAEENPSALSAPPAAETPAYEQDQLFFAAVEPEWHEFWTPFSSEIAARGFVNRLESVTGLDYRVTRVRTGRYQVEFAYGDPAELDAHLLQIAAATGLDVSGELP